MLFLKRSWLVFFTFFLLPRLRTQVERMIRSAFLFAFFLLPFTFSLAAAQSSVSTYQDLISAIRSVRHETQSRIEAAVEQEKVREAWETGKLIQEHILLNKDRAEYGKQVMKRLSADLETSESELHRMVEFARAYPIFAAQRKLSWAHYKELLSVNDEKERNEIAEEAVRRGWGQREVRSEINRRKAGSSLVASHPSLEEIKPGPLYTYQIVRLQDRLKIDLGFGIYRDLSEKDTKKFKEGDIVRISKKGLESSVSGLASLYTYSAVVTQVVDGDTFHALIDLGFETTMAQRIRLRRIDAPEIVSAEGKEAKIYLEKILKRDSGRILLQSRELDQHGRPIADVWVQNKSIDQELLDKGFAVRIED